MKNNTIQSKTAFALLVPQGTPALTVSVSTMGRRRFSFVREDFYEYWKVVKQNAIQALASKH